MFSGHVPERRCSWIGPRQQVVDLAIGMTGDNSGDDVCEVSLRFDVAEFTGLD